MRVKRFSFKEFYALLPWTPAHNTRDHGPSITGNVDGPRRVVRTGARNRTRVTRTAIE